MEKHHTCMIRGLKYVGKCKIVTIDSPDSHRLCKNCVCVCVFSLLAHGLGTRRCNNDIKFHWCRYLQTYIPHMAKT